MSDRRGFFVLGDFILSINYGVSDRLISKVLSAVQHERGPRKPKIHQPPPIHISPPGALHHIPQDNKLSPPAPGGLHFPLFGPPHHLKVLPPPPQPGSPGSGPSGAQLEPLPPPMFHPQALPPPPGLLQILMSAEKCQVCSTSPPRLHGNAVFFLVFLRIWVLSRC